MWVENIPAKGYKLYQIEVSDENRIVNPNNYSSVSEVNVLEEELKDML